MPNTYLLHNFNLNAISLSEALAPYTGSTTDEALTPYTGLTTERSLNLNTQYWCSVTDSRPLELQQPHDICNVLIYGMLMCSP